MLMLLGLMRREGVGVWEVGVRLYDFDFDYWVWEEARLGARSKEK
jgi:hypothetical protein